MQRIRGILTYANVISTVCLFLLLGGGAAFAATQLPKNSVGAKQLKKEAVTLAKIAKSAQTSLKGATGPAGAAGPKGATGAPGGKGDKGEKGEKGLQGLTGEAGSAVAYAHVGADGGVDLENSKNITTANIEHNEAGVYCFKELGFAAHVAVASADGRGPIDGILANVVAGGGFGTCDASAQVRVRTTTVAAPSTATDHPFYIIFD
jgi:hypothetical protein